MAEVGELLEEISSALLRYQAEKRIPQGYLLQHDTVVYELARNRRNTLVFVTNGVIPMVVVNRMEAVLMCEKMPKVRSEISVVRVFSVGNVSYFALGYKDGTMLVFSCKTDSKELTLVVQFASSSEEDLKGSGREIFYIQQQPINCLNRFQENLVYMWVGFGSKVMLVTFKTEQMNGALGVMLEYRINEAKLGKLVQVEIHNSAYGTNTMTAFHFWSPGAARIVALDARQALFWAEKARKNNLQRFTLLTLPPPLEIALPPGHRLDKSRVDPASIMCASCVSTSSGFQGNTPHRDALSQAPFSFAVSVVTYDGARKRTRLTRNLVTAQQLVVDCIASNSSHALTDPDSLIVDFTASDADHVIVNIEGGQMSVAQAVQVLGMTSEHYTSSGASNSTARSIAAVMDLCITSTLAPLFKDHMLSRFEDGIREGEFRFLEVKRVQTYVEHFKNEMERSLIKISKEKILELLYGKRAAVLNEEDQGAVYSNDISLAVISELCGLLAQCSGLLVLAEGLLERKMCDDLWGGEPIPAGGHAYQSEARLEYARSLDQLQIQKTEVQCLSQIVSVLIEVCLTPGLSFYCLNSNYQRMLQHRRSQYENVLEIIPPSLLPLTPTCLFDELAVHLEPERREDADLREIASITGAGQNLQRTVEADEKVMKFLFLPLRNLRTATDKEGAIRGLAAADVGHSVVHHALLDMLLISHAPAFAIGQAAAPAPGLLTDIFSAFSYRIGAASRVEVVLSKTLLSLWKLDASFDVSTAVNAIATSPSVISDPRMLEASVRQLLVARNLKHARTLLTQWTHSDLLCTPFGAKALAAAVPGVHSFQVVWHSARRQCQRLSPADALRTKVEVAEIMARWTLSVGELGDFLEATMDEDEAMAVQRFLETLMSAEIERKLQEDQHTSTLVLWLLHRGKVAAARMAFETYCKAYEIASGAVHQSERLAVADTMLRSFAGRE